MDVTVTDRRFHGLPRKWTSVYEILPDGSQGRLLGILRGDQRTNFQDVHAFHVKFGLPIPPEPTLLDNDTLHFRFNFMEEELRELLIAHSNGNLADAADALIDLVYVAMGTAVMMGLPWEELWTEVQRANLTKERATRVEDSKRGSLLDVVKPEGWRAPDHKPIIERYMKTAQREESSDEDLVHGDQRAAR